MFIEIMYNIHTPVYSEIFPYIFYETVKNIYEVKSAIYHHNSTSIDPAQQGPRRQALLFYIKHGDSVSAIVTWFSRKNNQSAKN